MFAYKFIMPVKELQTRNFFGGASLLASGRMWHNVGVVKFLGHTCCLGQELQANFFGFNLYGSWDTLAGDFFIKRCNIKVYPTKIVWPKIKKHGKQRVYIAKIIIKDIYNITRKPTTPKTSQKI